VTVLINPPPLSACPSIVVLPIHRITAMTRLSASLLRTACAAALLLLISSAAAWAQPGPGRGGPAFNLADTLRVKLGLTPQQTLAVDSIFKASREQARLDREVFAGDREAMMEASRQRNEKMYADIEALLTPEQKTKLPAVREEMDARMRNRLRERPGRGE
jgi:hypothetical protein